MDRRFSPALPAGADRRGEPVGPPAASRRAPPAASVPPAVDQELGEGATLRVAPILADPLATFEVGREAVLRSERVEGLRALPCSRCSTGRVLSRVFNSSPTDCGPWTTHGPHSRMSCCEAETELDRRKLLLRDQASLGSSRAAHESSGRAPRATEPRADRAGCPTAGCTGSCPLSPRRTRRRSDSRATHTGPGRRSPAPPRPRGHQP